MCECKVDQEKRTITCEQSKESRAIALLKKLLIAKERHVQLLNEEVLILRKKAEFLEARVNDSDAIIKKLMESKVKE